MDDDYTRALHTDGRDLVAAAREGRLTPALFRDAEVAAVIDALGRGRSVVLVGASGAGKSAVVHAVATELAGADRAMFELSTAGLLAGTKYLGEWQSKLTRVVQAASELDAVLYITDLWHLPSAGVTVQSTHNMFDALRPHLEAGRVCLVGEASPEHLRKMQGVAGFLDRFEQVRVDPMDAVRVERVVDAAAADRSLAMDAPTRQALIRLTSRFLPARPQPAPALSLLDKVADYQEQKRQVGEAEPLTPVFVEKVLSIYSGLPLFIVSPNTTQRATDIRAWFQERIVGQHEAIEAVVETIALFKAGLNDPTRPIGTFLFVGPTGVGKTEVARALATFLFGSARRLLRFDLSEFKDYHAFELLLGSPGRPGRPARLVDPVRSQPFQVILFDELEKAHPNLWDLLLPLIDEGRLTTPGGDTVDFRSTLVIATSNAGMEKADHAAVGFGDGGSTSERLRQALEKHFRPEFLNRFGHIVTFHRLSTEQVRTVARQELKRVFAREGITRRNLVVDIDDDALDVVIRRGVDPRYGARALKREIQRQIVLPLALYLMERDADPGQIVKVTAREGSIRIRALDTPESRAARREREPVRVDDRTLQRTDLMPAVHAAMQRVEELSAAVDEEFLHKERARLLELRAEHTFWQYPEHAARSLRDLDLATGTLDRLDRLRQRLDELSDLAAGAETRREVEITGRRLTTLERSLDLAWRELVVMGDDGRWDALVEVSPIGPTGCLARDLLLETYLGWARSRRMDVDWLRVPLADDEPAMVAIKGRYAHGLLRLEHGLHKGRVGDEHTAARVRVAAWTDRSVPVAFGVHRALKGSRFMGEKVRSRIECGLGLVLQNHRTLAENRDLAVELAGSWGEAPAPSDAIVRRYDRDAPLLRDVFTGFSSGRPDALDAERFHDLLCNRVDLAAERGPETA